MDRLWCGGKTRRKEKGNDAEQPVVPDEWNFKSTAPAQVDARIPEVNMDLSGMDTISVVINRGRQGFGFTVVGSSPVQVGRVDEDSPAFKAGLRKNDCIVRISGQNVSRSMAESVARIVRETENTLCLEIQRRSADGDSISSSDWELYTDETPSRPPASGPNPAMHDHMFSQQPPCSVHPKPQLPPRRPLTPIVNVQVPARSKAQNDPDQSSLCSFDCDQMSSCSDSTTITSASEGAPLPFPRRAQTSVRSKKPPMPPPTESDRNDDSKHKQDKKQEKGDSAGADSGEDRCADEEKDRTHSPATDDKKISSYKQVQWSAIQKLFSCEEDFLSQMHNGLVRYLFPLRKQYLTLDQHWAVFQNIEEIISFSQYRFQELRQQMTSSNAGQSPPSDNSVHDSLAESRLSIATLASVYLAKIDSLCIAYAAYCPGVMNALHLLASLKKSNPDLQAYLKKIAAQDPNRFTLSAFLQKPIEHIKELVLALQKILCYMETTTTDYSSLKQVVQAVRSCCSAINACHMQRCGSSMTSLASIESTPMKSVSSSSSSSSSTASSSATTSDVAASVVSSIDAEVLEMQSRLVFPENVRSFHLATASHHMIYSGRLTLIECGSTIPLFVALLSDLLVLTRPDPVGQTLFVLEEPILLQDVVGCTFNCTHQCEFVISVETPLTTLQSSWTPRSLVMRAPTVELKCTWKNILEQRITACKTQREVNINTRRTDNIV